MNVNFVLEVCAKGQGTFLRREAALLAEKWKVMPGSIFRTSGKSIFTVREVLVIYASYMAGVIEGNWK